MADRTKREYFSEILEMVAENVELANFVNRELHLLDKKNKSKSKAQLEAEANTVALTEKIVDFFKVNPVEKFSATELANANDETVQKVTSILTKLVADEILVRKVSKGKANFSLKA